MSDAANATGESIELLRQLENKMSGLMGVMDSVSRKVDKTNDMFLSPDSAYFINMSGALSSSLHENDMERRLYDEAKEQNARAMRMMGGRSPERGDGTFWQQAFTPTPMTQAEVQAAALKSTFRDGGVIDSFKAMLGGIRESDGGAGKMKAIIDEALRGKADERTFGERALDKVGLGGINKIKDWFADRDLRKEEKATARDRGAIKREQKQMDRLAAKYRKMEAAGADEAELLDIRDRIASSHRAQQAAASRIMERRNDDLFETSIRGTGADRGKSELQSVLESAMGGRGAREPVAPAARGTDRPGLPGVPHPAGRFDNAERIAEPHVPLASVKDITGDRNEPVELAKAVKGSSAQVGDAREAMDIQRKLDTTLRPDFYKEGIDFFKKGNRGELFDELKDSLGGGILGVNGGAKVGLYASAAAAVGASAAKIGQATTLVKDWYNASSGAVENVKEMTERTNAALEKRKNGINDEMLGAAQASNVADQKLHESQESWADAAGSFIKDDLLGGFFGKSDRRKAEEAAVAADSKFRTERDRFREMTEAARKAGIDTSDMEEMKKFKELYDLEQAERNGSSGGERLAAGNLQESATADTVQTPGASVEPEKVETAEEQRRRIEESTYQGTKRALLDSEVQRKNEENAKIQGREIDQSLNGRK